MNLYEAIIASAVMAPVPAPSPALPSSALPGPGVHIVGRQPLTDQFGIFYFEVFRAHPVS